MLKTEINACHTLLYFYYIFIIISMYNHGTYILQQTYSIRNIVLSYKYLNEYEIAIQESFDELFATKTLIKREIIKYYIHNLYTSSSN